MRDKNLFGMLLVIGLGCSVADHSVAGVLTANGAELTLRNTSPIDGGELRLRNTSAIGPAANLTLQNSAAISFNTSGPMAMPGDTPQIGGGTIILRAAVDDLVPTITTYMMTLTQVAVSPMAAQELAIVETFIPFQAPLVPSAVPAPSPFMLSVFGVIGLMFARGKPPV